VVPESFWPLEYADAPQDMAQAGSFQVRRRVYLSCGFHSVCSVCVQCCAHAVCMLCVLVAFCVVSIVCVGCFLCSQHCVRLLLFV